MELDKNELYELVESYRRELGEVRSALNDAHELLKTAAAENEKLSADKETIQADTARKVFVDVKELLTMGMRVEHHKYTFPKPYTDKSKHRYAESFCETLLADLQIIERKYTER